MNWNLWSRQIDAIVRMELKRYILARRWVGIYVLALAPVFLLVLRLLVISNRRFDEALSPVEIGNAYAVIFQLFILRFAIFISSSIIFSQSFRGEVLEKTLHFYLLAPAHRGVIVAGKYMAGVVASIILFGSCTIVTYLLMYFPSPSFRTFFFEGSGIAYLARYLAVTMLACITYGAVFLLVGLLFKNPGPATAFLLAWESFSFVLPSLLQTFSVVYYLQSMLPVTVNRGPLAIISEPTSPILGVPGLLIAVIALLYAASLVLCRVQVTYSAD